MIFKGKPLSRVEANLRNVNCQVKNAMHCVSPDILLQNKDVIFNPLSPVNHDSKQDAINIVNGSRRGELNSPFFNHYLFFYSNYHAHNRSSIHLINLQNTPVTRRKNAIVPRIGKCICIMGGRMQFAPTTSVKSHNP